MAGNREYKSDVFSMLLEDPKNALEVFNGVNGTDYDDPNEFVKDNENYSLEGAEFEITSTTDNTIKYTVKTNADGVATTTDKVPFGTYKVKETVAPKGYTLNTDEFTVTLSKDSPVVETISVATVSVEEPVKSIRIRVTKADKETETEAQGSATLNGAVFEIYDKERLLHNWYFCPDCTADWDKHKDEYCKKPVTFIYIPPTEYIAPKDLYFNDRWVASRGSYRSILEEAMAVMEEELLNS